MTKSLNNGILSRKAAPVRWADVHGTNYIQAPEVITVPLWKATVVMIGLLSMTASFVYSVRPAPEVVMKVREVPVDHLVPTCDAPLALTKSKAFIGMQQQLAAAVPASALRHWGK